MGGDGPQHGGEAKGEDDGEKGPTRRAGGVALAGSQDVGDEGSDGESLGNGGGEPDRLEGGGNGEGGEDDREKGAVSLGGEGWGDASGDSGEQRGRGGRGR